MAKKQKQKFYAVAKGHRPGIYSDWKDCQAQVSSVSHALFKSFNTFNEANAFMTKHQVSGFYVSQQTVSRKQTTTSRAPPKQLRQVSMFGGKPKVTAKPSSIRKGGSKVEHQQRIEDLLESFKPDSVVCFTDGACQGNPGPCGAGAVVQLPPMQPKASSSSSSSSTDEKEKPVVVEKHLALGQGTNNIGELTAIGLALDILAQHEKDASNSFTLPKGARVEILTDSNYSIGMLMKGWKATANVKLIEAVRDKLSKRCIMGNPVQLHWVAGHAGVPGNERADELANMGVTESKLRML